MLVALADVYAQIPDLDQVRELMRATQERVREQPGCIDYVFAETVHDPGHFVVVQQWRDQTALDAHYRSQAFVDYQTQIATSLVRTSELRVHAVSASYVPFDPAPIGPAEVD